MFLTNRGQFTAYSILIILIMFQRLGEVLYGKRNEKKLLSMGGVEFGKSFYYLLIVYQIIGLIVCLFADYINDVPANFFEIFLGLMLFFIGQSFRIMSVATLKTRWTTKIIVVPGEPLVRKGIYKVIRHPDYLGFILECFALPLIAGLSKVAVVLGILGIIIMLRKVMIEERTLNQYANYNRIFQSQKRVIPYII